MFSDQIYKFFADYIYKFSGIHYAEKDFYRLNGRLTTLMNELNITEPEELLKKFSAGVSPTAHALLIDISTNNETYFLRDKKPFSLLTQKIIPEISNKRPNTPVRIWSAGCSTGQEPYSILMECLEKGIKLSQIQIDATDISTKALEKAKSGNYTGLEVQRGLPITYLTKYFEIQPNETWSVKKELRDKINFRPFNLLTDLFPLNKYDVIFCRNVLIYQDMKNREKIIQAFSKSVVSDGSLIMGSGESILGMKVDFKLNMIDNSMVFQKAS